MRIVVLNPTGQIGGAERSLLDVMVSLRQAQPGWDLHLVAGDCGPLVDACREIGVPVRVVPLPHELARLGDAGAGCTAGRELSKTVLLGRLAFASVATARYARSLRRLLNELKPDIIHTNGFKMHALGAWAKPARVPLVWHIHDYVSSRVVMAKLLRMFAGRCNTAIAISASVAEDFQSALKPRMPVHKIWNAVDLKEFSSEGSRLDLDRASGLPPAPNDVVRVGLVATMAKWKGHDIFLRALSMLSANLPVRGYIIGGPLYQTDGSQWTLDKLKQQAAQLGLSGRVGFTGFVPRSSEAMRSLDIIVHASTKPEPFGLVIIEAMACHRAVIASRSGGSAEISEDGVNALSHKPGDPEDLARVIVRLTINSNLRERLGTAGRQTAEQNFDRTRLGIQLAPIYQSVISADRAEAA